MIFLFKLSQQVHPKIVEKALNLQQTYETMYIFAVSNCNWTRLQENNETILAVPFSHFKI